MKPLKYKNFQMGLFDEWECSQAVKGSDVFSSGSGQVRHEWLSRCRKERALTQYLMSEVADLKNLETALRKVIGNKGSAGTDGMNVHELRNWFNIHYHELQTQLRAGTYRVTAVKEVKIPKPGGGQRQLGISTVKDRLVQQAISQVLSKRYDPTFSDHSYGFRPKRNAHQALHKAGDYVASGKNWVVDIDLAKFFDEVNHDRLLWMLSTRIGDKDLLKLIGRFLRAGIMRAGMTSQRVKGTPQGSPLSPLLSNIILDELDKELERRGHQFVRYADDFLIFCKSKRSSERVMRSVTKFIEESLYLKVNREKSQTVSYREIKFLGYSFYKTKGEGRLRVHSKSVAKMKAKIKELTSRSNGWGNERRKEVLSQYIKGWVQYFKLADMKSLLQRTDEWYRRRLRMVIWKQWKRIKTKLANLIKLGLKKSKAWEWSNTRKGYWHTANSFILSTTITNERLQQAGYLFFTDYYRSLKVVN